MDGRSEKSTTPTKVQQEDRYVVHLDVFEGPLDLLLHLIEKRQMEITMISLLAVTDQYLAYLNHKDAESLPIADMASFVAIAARLLYIKSQSLLPQNPKEDAQILNESAAAMADELQRHLLEYKLAKEIAQALRQREEAGLQTHSRSSLLAGIETQLAWTPPTLVGLDTSMLMKAFQRLLENQESKKGERGDILMPTRRVRVSEQVAEIMGRLRQKPTLMLSELVENEESRIVIVVTFIAVLELWKWQRIEVTQEGLLAPILLERGPAWDQGGDVALDQD